MNPGLKSFGVEDNVVKHKKGKYLKTPLKIGS